MSNQIDNKTTVKNFIWRFAERCGAQGVSFIVSIVLARLLEPSVYGTIALVTVFTTILQVFVDSGLGTALIQKKMQMTWIFRRCSILILRFVLFYIWECLFRLRILQSFMEMKR